MTRADFLRLMHFPSEWEAWNAVPDAWLAGALKEYTPGQEAGSEHYRHGAFQWWLKNKPSKDILLKLAKLSWLDPDHPMGGYVRESIAKCGACDSEVKDALNQRS